MVLHRAIQAARVGDLATLKDLASSGHLPPAVSDVQGAGPVHHAARCGRLDCLQFLVNKLGLAADPRALNGATPAHDAAATGNIRELQWLMDQGGCNIEVSVSTESKFYVKRERNLPRELKWLGEMPSAAFLEFNVKYIYLRTVLHLTADLR